MRSNQFNCTIRLHICLCCFVLRGQDIHDLKMICTPSEAQTMPEVRLLHREPGRAPTPPAGVSDSNTEKCETAKVDSTGMGGVAILGKGVHQVHTDSSQRASPRKLNTGLDGDTGSHQHKSSKQRRSPRNDFPTGVHGKNLGPSDSAVGNPALSGMRRRSPQQFQDKPHYKSPGKGHHQQNGRANGMCSNKDIATMNGHCDAMKNSKPGNGFGKNLKPSGTRGGSPNVNMYHMDQNSSPRPGNDPQALRYRTNSCKTQTIWLSA